MSGGLGGTARPHSYTNHSRHCIVLLDNYMIRYCVVGELIAVVDSLKCFISSATMRRLIAVRDVSHDASLACMMATHVHTCLWLVFINKTSFRSKAKHKVNLKDIRKAPDTSDHGSAPLICFSYLFYFYQEIIIFLEVRCHANTKIKTKRP